MISKPLVAATLKPFILSLLAEGDNYGYEIIQMVGELTGGEVRWTTGTLYPLLHNLQNKGFVSSYQKKSHDGPGPKRTYYRLTKKGDAELADQRRQWFSMHEALSKLWGGQPNFAHS